MALSVLFNCPCGAGLKLYMPKALIYGEWMGNTDECWAALDAQEELDGEIELVRKGADLMSAFFVDGRESLECPVCGLDVGAIVKVDMQGGKNEQEG